MDFKGKTALVTGAASGIGWAVANALVTAGATVIGVDRDGSRLDSAVSRDATGRLSGMVADLRDKDTILTVRDQVTKQSGPVDVVVNAAGWDRNEAFMDNTDDFWVELTEINFLGTIRVTRAFLEPIVAAGRNARIVNVASDAGRVGSGGETVYAGTKGGVIAFTKSLAREMARYEITVNCVCPGPTDTPLLAAQPERVRAALIRAVPFRRLGKAEEVAAAVVYLASDTASFVTGQVLSVNGGIVMAG